MGSGTGVPVMSVEPDMKAGCRCTNHKIDDNHKIENTRVASVCNVGCGIDDDTKPCTQAATNKDFGPIKGANNRGHCAGACNPDIDDTTDMQKFFTFKQCFDECDEMGDDWSMIGSDLTREMASGSGCGYDSTNVWSKNNW